MWMKVTAAPKHPSPASIPVGPTASATVWLWLIVMASSRQRRAELRPELPLPASVRDKTQDSPPPSSHLLSATIRGGGSNNTCFSSV